MTNIFLHVELWNEQKVFIQISPIMIWGYVYGRLAPTYYYVLYETKF